MNKILIAIIAVIALLLGTLAYQKWQLSQQPKFALYYQQPRPIKPFTFDDHQGKPFSLENLYGKWSLVFFGYTSCPDVCPTTMQTLSFVYEDLQKESNNKVQVLLVSVDPQRDSQNKLSQYIGYFNDDFIALRADHGVLYPFARNLGLMYAIVNPQDEKYSENYLVDHSASIVLINPQGKIAAIFKPEIAVGRVPSIDGEKLLSDFTKIVALN
jgi:protein SCO1/2